MRDQVRSVPSSDARSKYGAIIGGSVPRCKSLRCISLYCSIAENVTWTSAADCQEGELAGCVEGFRHRRRRLPGRAFFPSNENRGRTWFRLASASPLARRRGVLGGRPRLGFSATRSVIADQLPLRLQSLPSEDVSVLCMCLRRTGRTSFQRLNLLLYLIYVEPKGPISTLRLAGRV